MSFRSTRWLRSTVVVGVVVAGAVALSSRSATATGPRRCPIELMHRTPEETVLDHVAAIQEGDLDAAMCDFAPNASVILPGQVATGLDDIRAGLEGMGGLLGGAVPEVDTLTSHGATVLLTFSAFGTPCEVPDGADTYVVLHGKIVAQTVHDTLHSAPGATCPLAPPGE